MASTMLQLVEAVQLLHVSRYSPHILFPHAERRFEGQYFSSLKNDIPHLDERCYQMAEAFELIHRGKHSRSSEDLNLDKALRLTEHDRIILDRLGRNLMLKLNLTSSRIADSMRLARTLRRRCISVGRTPSRPSHIYPSGLRSPTLPRDVAHLGRRCLWAS